MKRIFFLIMFAALATSSFARQPETGYRGFIEWANDLRSEPGFSKREMNYHTGVSTSHGYQIKPWIFAGAGISYEKSTQYSSTILPVFLQCRTDLKFGKYTPFGDVRIGYSLTDGGGVYFSPSIGYRFNWGRKMGLNIGAGLSIKGYSYNIMEIYETPEGYISLRPIGKSRSSLAFFSFRIGIDF